MPLFKINCFLFILLAAATLISHTRINQYEQTGPDLLTAHWQLKTSESNRVNITENGLTLLANDAKTSASTQQDLPLVNSGTTLLVSADVKCTNVVTGEKPWNLARIILAQNDGEKDQWDLPHTVVALAGTADWKHYRTAFTISPETKNIRLLAQLNQSTGSFQIKNLQVYPVHVNQAYIGARDTILFAWGAFFLLLAGSCLFIRGKTVFFRALLLTTFIVIIVGISLPGDLKNQVSDEIKIQIDAESESFKTAIPWDLSKVWHFCFFFLFGLVLCLMMTKDPAIQVVAIILMLAGGTEMAQLYIDGRSPLITDFFIDAAGGIAGVILIRFFGMNKNIDHFENKATLR